MITMLGKLKYIDAFSGLGGFGICASRVAKAEGLEPECVASIEFDEDCRITYEKNFGHPQTHSLVILMC
jgi:site-specific DNA-cytosine methylase